jgi:glycine hydroxymethyltransferase
VVLGLKEFEKVGDLVTRVIKGLSENPDDNTKVELEVQKEVVELCSSFQSIKI